MSELQNFVHGHSIGDAWLQALERVVLRDVPYRYLTIHVDNPLCSLEIPDTTDLDDWSQVVNTGAVYEDYCKFDFEDESKVEGTTGRAWIESRIYEVYEGLYHDRLSEPDQIGMIADRLKEGNHGSCTNALVAQIFDVEKDLTVATSGKPFAPDMACMTQVQFRPKKDRLHCFATFRSQYMDSKCYGNLIALAMLMGQICDESGYEPGILVEHANNTIRYSRQSSLDLVVELLSWQNQGHGLRIAEHALERLGIENEEFADSVASMYIAWVLNKTDSYPIGAAIGAIIWELGDQVEFEVNVYRVAEAVGSRAAELHKARDELRTFYTKPDDYVSGP